MIVKKPYILESIIKETDNVNLYRFRAQDHASLDFTPGMFAMLYYRDQATGEEIGRAYSIASEPGVDYLDFIIELVHGKLTSKLELAKEGDIYYISAPYGQFKFDTSLGSKFLFLAGGTGIAPFFSMLKYAAKNAIDADIVVIDSVRYPSSIIAKQDLDALQALEKPKIRCIITVTRPQPGDGWTGATGHIDANMLAKYVPDLAERVCYICGPLGFTKAMKDLLSSLGMPTQKIKTEMWGGG